MVCVCERGERDRESEVCYFNSRLREECGKKEKETERAEERKFENKREATGVYNRKSEKARGVCQCEGRCEDHAPLPLHRTRENKGEPQTWQGRQFVQNSRHTARRLKKGKENGSQKGSKRIHWYQLSTCSCALQKKCSIAQNDKIWERRQTFSISESGRTGRKRIDANEETRLSVKEQGWKSRDL